MCLRDLTLFATGGSLSGRYSLGAACGLYALGSSGSRGLFRLTKILPDAGV
jgi:hypothetical protein